MKLQNATALLDDIRWKKGQRAYRDTECDVCTEFIGEGDEFVFYGDGNKMCLDCRQSIESELEEILESNGDKNKKNHDNADILD